ncbi:hypothetical protein [Vibrio vulnificus]|uniref:hypothetical protein n=1 Tax=Vibrio vulnificus TaxID=672 RepID=UPI00165E966B|nr:hypothetical protein [Vibrio vulnificus]
MTDNTVVSLNTPQDPLTELIRQGARDLIAQAVKLGNGVGCPLTGRYGTEG